MMETLILWQLRILIIAQFAERNYRKDEIMEDVFISIVITALFIIMALWIYAMMRVAKISDERMAIMSNTCPDCGSRLIREGGCTRCSNPICGWSPCQ